MVRRQRTLRLVAAATVALLRIASLALGYFSTYTVQPPFPYGSRC
ncbi:hypothetical protein [Arthrobacter crystallopoietes]|nr:hypothetical protein [Arthrobacter crystallopoietes]